MVMITLYARQQKTQMYRTVYSIDSVGEGKGGMIWENGIETRISSVKRLASPRSMHDTGCSGLALG